MHWFGSLISGSRAVLLRGISPEWILRAVDAGRRLGVTATASCLMIPAKSVTAVIGLSDKPQGAKIRGCAYCTLREDCAYRKRGTVCGA